MTVSSEAKSLLTAIRPKETNEAKDSCCSRIARFKSRTLEGKVKTTSIWSWFINSRAPANNRTDSLWILLFPSKSDEWLNFNIFTGLLESSSQRRMSNEPVQYSPDTARPTTFFKITKLDESTNSLHKRIQQSC